MDIHRNNYNYTFEEYESDIKSLRDTLSGIKNRGSSQELSLSFYMLFIAPA